MSKEQDKPRFTTNEVFTRLAASGNENALALSGYAVESDRPGYLKLILGINELSETIEIAFEDVVETAGLRSFDLGASVVWVRRGALIHHGKTEPVEDYLANWRAGKSVMIKRRGLRMKTRLNARDAREVCYCDPPVSICQGCQPCTCNCIQQQ
jgi:hypothetical protein